MEEFDLQPGEHVITSIRLHPFVLALTLLPYVFLALVPALLGKLLDVFATFSMETAAVIPALDPAVMTLLTGFWWLFVWMAAFAAFTRYYLTLWVITNLRIVDIRQFGFFSRSVSSFLLARVQDVTTEIYGILGTLIGYGRLNVQTAGQEEDFYLDDMPHPQLVRDLIMDQVAKLQHGPAGL